MKRMPSSSVQNSSVQNSGVLDSGVQAGFRWVFAGMLALPGLTMAAEAPVTTSSSGGGQLLQVTLALVAVLVVIGLVAWVMKRFTGLAPQHHQQLRTLAVLAVGTRERVALLKVGERQILVGITPQQISTLLVLDEPLDMAAPSSDFARKLQSLLHRNEDEAKGEANDTR